MTSDKWHETHDSDNERYSDKWTITAPFLITISRYFFPGSFIYGGKTSKCIPAVSFPSEFLLAVNEQNYNNEREIIKMLEHIIIIIPYVRSLRNTLDVDSNRWTLLILDVFKEKMTLPGERITEKKFSSGKVTSKQDLPFFSH